ncbi:MAG: hypothetical protein MZV64_42345 [Ignavibacteriales bacterium]|nr:hypothetical protein [Ignavibacteriales bacterium]
MGDFYRPIEAMVRAINGASDGDFVAAVSAYTNLTDFMRLTAVQAAIGEADGLLGNWGLSNHFLYRLGQSSLHRFIPLGRVEFAARPRLPAPRRARGRERADAPG